jgi:hypothetical protein
VPEAKGKHQFSTPNVRSARSGFATRVSGAVMSIFVRPVAVYARVINHSA